MPFTDQHDLVNRQGEIRVGVRRHLDGPVVGADEHRILSGEPLGGRHADPGLLADVPRVVLAPQRAPAGVG